jgi:erythromycin esterase-like protein
MTEQSTRDFIVGTASAVVSAVGLEVSARQPDNLQVWLAANAVPVRSIDAADEDFGDLEPLIAAMGSARVVQLGEPSHGAGASFAAKVRIIKCLHQRLGFDVLIWESGFYDVELAQAGMRSADDAITAAGRGIFSIWSAAAEVRHLFEYVKASQASTRPYEMAGLTCKSPLHDQRSASLLICDLSSMRRESTWYGRERASLADEAIASRERLFTSKFATAADLESLDKASGGLLAVISAERAAFEEVKGARWTAFMEIAIENMCLDARNRYGGSS